MIPLLVDMEREWRGGQNQFFLLLKGLYERGHAAELLAVKGSSLGHRAAKAGICVHYAGSGKLDLSAAIAVRKLMSDGRFDLVHVNESHALTAAWLARAHRRVPLLISRRVGYPIRNGYFSRARFRAGARLIASSHWIAKQAVASGAPADRVTVIYEGVEIPPQVQSEVRQKARARWNIGEDQPLLGCAGVLLPDKGQDFAIRALAQLRKDRPNCKLLLAGTGRNRPQLDALVQELHLNEGVIFAGFVPDVEVFYQALDVFLFPVLFEGLGTSLLAAMAHGIPSVTYFGCALGEIVENGKSGIQVEPRNVEALAGAVCAILDDRQIAAQLGAAGRQRIGDMFSAERMVDGTIQLYRSVIG